MKIGIYEKAINKKFDWSSKIKIAKEAGFDFIEFSIDESDEKQARLDWSDEKINELRKLLIANDFYFNSMALSGLRKYPLGSHDEKIRKKSILIVEKAIILAKKLGIRNIQLAGYDVFYEESDENTVKWFIEGCKNVAQLAQKYSMMLSFETMDTSFMGTISKVKKYLDKVNSPWLTVYPDIGNLYQWTDDVKSEIVEGKNIITGIHFKDTKQNTFRDVLWGEGTVDFKLCMQSLKAIGYSGPFLIEMWSKNNDTETMQENIVELKNAKAFFNNYKY